MTSASLTTTTIDYAHAVETCRRDCPDLGLGLHFTLSAGRPVSDPSSVPLLVDEEGYFRWRFGSLALKVGVRRCPELVRQIARELEAQLARLEEDGVELDHIDSERHVHQIPGIFELVVAAAEKRGIGWIRLGRDSGWRHSRTAHLPSLLGRGGALKHAILSLLSARNRRHVGALRWTDRFASYLYSGRLHQILDRLAAEPTPGVVEVMVHPGISDLSRDLDLGNPPLEAYLQSTDRLEELDACITARQQIDRRRLTTFSGLSTLLQGKKPKAASTY